MPTPAAWTRPLSRRRALALATGLLAGMSRAPRIVAQETPIASPAAPPPDGASGSGTFGTVLPLPGTLAHDASAAFRSVAEALVAAMRQYQVPGAALGLLAGDREEHATFGVASASSLRPVTPETLFQIGSITKTYTATAIWRLMDEEALALDAPVRTYIPELTLMDEAAAASVTVGNLLDHTAGFYGDEGVDTGGGDEALQRYVAERLPQLPQLFPVGRFASYNNAAFTLQGRLIEVATGTPYNAAMASLLLEPLGLRQTLLDHDAVLQHPYTDGHTLVMSDGTLKAAVQTPLWLPRCLDPAGGLWSTSRDMLRYARFHLHPGTVSGPAAVVDPGSLIQMQQPASAFPGVPIAMGRSWLVQDVAGMRAISHDGDTLGHHATLLIVPEQGFALAVLTNNGSGALAAQAVLDAALGQFPPLASLVGKVGLRAALVVPADAPTVGRSPDDLAAYAGRFADPGGSFTFTPSHDGLHVAIDEIHEPGSWWPVIAGPPTEPAAVAFLAPDIAVLNRQRLPFVRDERGRVHWVASGLRIRPRVGTD